MADKGERPQQADDAFRNALRAWLEANSFGLRLEDLMGRSAEDADASDEGAQD